ncbi:hypothetical protein HF521_020013, partial [Silurus meridionalis]
TQPRSPTLSVKLDGRITEALLDSGSNVTLARPSVIARGTKRMGSIPVACVHGDVHEVPTVRVRVANGGGEWPLVIGLVPNLPVPLLLGRDWPGFQRQQAIARRTSRRGGDRKLLRRSGKRTHTALMAHEQETQDTGAEGESGVDGDNPLFNVCHQASREGNFGLEQRKDDSLKYCWNQVVQVGGDNGQPLPHLYFTVKNGLLYYHMERRGRVGDCDLLVLPKTKTGSVMHLAHTHPLGGHLGPRNTLEKIRDRFHWTGMEAEVRRFCQGCPTCQHTSPTKPPPAPLIPLPIIRVKHVRTSVYHPQTDGLGERFNQTLKRMLRRVEHMEQAQAEHRRVYNRPAQQREFNPGDRVLLLVPTSTCKFLARWQGPFTVLEKVGPVNYRLQQPGKRKDIQLYHVNLLKKWVGTNPVVSALCISPTDPLEWALVGRGGANAGATAEPDRTGGPVFGCVLCDSWYDPPGAARN